MTQYSLRQFVLVAHRWLGLGSCVLLAIIGASGAAYLIPAFDRYRPFLERLHMHLLIPRAGQGIVIAASVAAVLLEAGGVYLWWNRKLWTIRWRAGWRTAVQDIHHVSGIIMLAVMLLLAGTGVGRVAVRQVFPSRSFIVKATNYAHTGLAFPGPIQAIYVIGALGFLVQGTTGVIMWWPRGSRTRRLPTEAARPADG
jgi:uncharacterized iron-regulated membrane protein